MNRGKSLMHSNRDLLLLDRNIFLDKILYQEAYEIFLRRVSYAEADLGFPILCEKRDGQDSLDLLRYVQIHS